MNIETNSVLHSHLVSTSSTHEYQVIVSDTILKQPALFQKYFKHAPKVLIVTDDIVSKLYLNDLIEVLKKNTHCEIYNLVLPAGEAHKNQNSVDTIHQKLIQHHFDKSSVLIAFGGGVISDVVGFASSIYQRGVAYINMPTTLLSAVDASVGGKTAINHSLAKNYIGSFHQPSAVWIETNFFRSLPQRAIHAAFSEMVKYAIIEGDPFFQKLYTFLSSGMPSEQWPEMILSCIQIKSRYVSKDVHDVLGQRAILNLGHTFAHALEAMSLYEKWLHGEAVAIGLYCALLLSQAYFGLEQSIINAIDGLLNQLNLPNRIPKAYETKLPKLIEYMYRDKKVKQGQLTFILVKEIGSCCVVHDVEQSMLLHILRRALMDHDA